MATAVFILQATSTFLASDLGLVEIDGDPISRSVSFGFRLEENIDRPLGLPRGDILDPWTSRSSYYPAFAEYQEPSVAGDNFVDTVLAMRAMLPFLGKQERADLRSFTGPARVLEAQVVCVQPAAQMNTSLQYALDRFEIAVSPKKPFSAQYIDRLSGGHLAISGEYEWKDRLPMLDLPEIPYRGEVGSACVIPTPEGLKPDATSEEIGAFVVLCPVVPLAEGSSYWPLGMRSTIINPAEKNSTSNRANCEAITDSPTLGGGMCRLQPIAFAAFRADSMPDLWKNAFSLRKSKARLNKDITAAYYPKREWSWNGSSSSAWSTLEANELSPKISKNLCFTSNMMRSRHVHFKARQEPSKDSTLQWDASKQAWNTRALISFLTRQLIPDSSMVPFKLNSMDDWFHSLSLGELGEDTVSMGAIVFKNRTGSRWDDGGYESNLVFKWTSIVRGQLTICVRCKAGAVNIHSSHFALFRDVLGQTSNLALAIQTLFTTTLQATYYEYLPHMIMEGQAQFVMSNSRTVPARFSALYIVLILSFIQLTGLSIILWRFYAAEDDGLKFCVGKTWQAAMHTHCKEIEWLLEDLGNRWMKTLKKCSKKKVIISM
ncbi:hypothetical protein P154DRAFT_578762 [Amniculicola lignicola CBS 123094]|uniref:Uncharacterized protein n=1 Tax=Amniculicola lignicola CBS 123094 TaxID=1392246 RepID=A0A6A5WJ06_9PLEO|nr:hypothetical protein P154DRAFT_578762 [Amniculicola lignicola CBS 123094]